MEAESRELRLIAQVCLVKGDTEIVGFASVRGGTVPSMGSGGIKKTGTTISGQSVFETYTEFPKELIVNAVSIKGQSTRYIFSPSRIVPRQEWSDWLEPQFVTDEEDYWWKILHDRTYLKLSSPPDSPKIRYMLMSFNDYLKRVRLRRDGQHFESIPAC